MSKEKSAGKKSGKKAPAMNLIEKRSAKAEKRKQKGIESTISQLRTVNNK